MSVGAAPVRASTSSRSADEANGTCHFTPSRRQPSPSGVAVRSTPLGPNPWAGSSQATEKIDAPDTILGSHVDFWSSEPAATRAPADSTADTRWGDGTRPRPSSS